MKAWTTLLYQLEKAATDATRQEAWLWYFQSTEKDDCLWGVWLLLGNKPRKSLSPHLLQSWTMQLTQIPDWLFEESLAATNDLSETCALLLGTSSLVESKTLSHYLPQLLSLSKVEVDEKKKVVQDAWQELSVQERYWFNRLLIGNFRFSVKVSNLVAAMAQFTDRPPHTLWYRLLADWSPSEIVFDDYFCQSRPMDDLVLPDEFVTFRQMENQPSLSTLKSSFACWYWEGICLQMIKRSGQIFLWSEDGEWLTGKFPELEALNNQIPDGTVWLGTLMAVKEGSILPVKRIQDRIKRKRFTKKLLEECPVVFLAMDVLEYKGKDLRQQQFISRRGVLEDWMSRYPTNEILLAENLNVKSSASLKEKLDSVRIHQAKGILLKEFNQMRLSADYLIPAPPLTLLAVLLYVTRDDRNPDKFSKLNFAVWKGEELVPIANCTNSLSIEDVDALTTFVKNNTIERFGPVISVNPSQVFKLSYTGLSASSRKKSGLDLQQVSIEEWLKQERVEAVDTLSALQTLQRELNFQ